MAPGRGVGCMAAVGSGTQGPLVCCLPLFLSVMLKGQHTVCTGSARIGLANEGTNIKPVRCIFIQELSAKSAHFDYATKRIINSCLPFLVFASSGITCYFEDNSLQLVLRVLRVR